MAIPNSSGSHDPHRNAAHEASSLLDSVSASQKSPSQGAYFSGDDNFSSFFDSDEEDAALRKVKEEQNPNAKVYTTELGIEKELENSIASLRKKYPMGGLKASRFITADILMKAPKNYFDEYEDTVKSAVNWVQNKISDQGRSVEIGRAQDDPTNEEKGDIAYRIVQAACAEYMDANSSYRALSRAIVINLVCNEIIGFSRIDALWRDRKIDEIICNGPYDIQVEIKGRLQRVPSCNFRDQDHLMALIERLYGALGKTVAKTTPIVDGRLHDNSRMAVIHPAVVPNGPNFVIRRHKEEYISPAQLVEWGSASKELMTFLGNLIHKGCSVLVIGGTSTGKTTLMSSLSGFYRPDHRILTLEDTLELRVAPGKMNAPGLECVEPRKDVPGSGINMRDLVKASLRHRPEVIIVGEVRAAEAYDLCQALNTGHYGMSTVHANSEHHAIYRLMSMISMDGLITSESTLPLIGASFDVIVQVQRMFDGSRRITSVSEVSPFTSRNEAGEIYLPITPLWRFMDDGLDDEMKVQGHWEHQNDISEQRRTFRRLDLERDLTWEELDALSSGK